MDFDLMFELCQLLGGEMYDSEVPPYIHIYIYIHAFIHTCIYTYMHTYIHTYIHA